MDESLDVVYRIQREVSILNEVLALLGWDESTHMPEKGVLGRSEQVRLINGLIYDRLTSAELSSAVEALKAGSLSHKNSMIVRELEKQVKRTSSVPKSFMQLLSRHALLSQAVWRKAKKSRDYGMFYPYLKKMVDLKRREALFLNPGSEPYDALLNNYEEGLTSERLSRFFSIIQAELEELIQEIRKSPAYRSQRKASIAVNGRAHKKLISDFMTKMGFSKKKMSLSTSMHPFSSLISKYDVRITTRYAPRVETFFDAVHEAGHALYDSNLPGEYYGTVVYQPASLGVHESQSTFWENMVCKSRAFWEGYYPEYSKVMLKPPSMEEFFFQVNMVRFSPVRINADEVTYTLHVILRYEIERRLINGSISVKDARDEWNKRSRELLGIRVVNDSKGILQDVHWASGDFGYFPAYSIGLAYAAQIHERMSKKIPDFRGGIREQRFDEVIGWLKKNIHEKGKTVTAENLIKKSCGRGLDPKTYTSYLREKYSMLYNLS